MSEDDGKGTAREAADRVAELEAELETSSDSVLDEEGVARLRDILHTWVDSVDAVVATPGNGRVVLIHKDGSESRISSSKLPYLLSPRANFGKTPN